MMSIFEMLCGEYLSYIIGEEDLNNVRDGYMKK